MQVSNLFPMDVIKYNGEICVVLEVEDIPDIAIRQVGNQSIQVEVVKVLLGTKTRQYWQYIELTENIEVLDDERQIDL